MKLGTIAYEGRIYNLDYMDSEEIKKLFENIESNKCKDLTEEKYENKK